MTNNQIKHREQQETARSNVARETETNRHNKATEAQAKRDTRAKYITTLGNTALGTGIKSILGAVNDPSWYNLNKALVANTANLPYGKPIGTPNNFGVVAWNGSVNGSSYTNPITPSYDGALAYPGIMHLKFMPTIGYSGDNLSTGIDIATKNIYSYVRHANSGSANYESEDLMLYFLAMDSLYMGIAWFMRVYSLLNDYKSEDYYFSEGYIRAMGLNPDHYCTHTASSMYSSSVYAHIADFRSWINVQITRLNALRVPDVMPLFKRHMWLTSNIFKDDSIKKSSNYIFSPRCLYQYDTANGRLVPVEWPQFLTVTAGATTGTSLCGLYDTMLVYEQLLEAVVGDEDIGIMSGDIQKAYGDSGLVNLSNMPDDYHVETIYSEEVLSQIRNLTLTPVVVPPYIGQNSSGYIVSGYEFDSSTGILTESKIPLLYSTSINPGISVYLSTSTNKYYAAYAPVNFSTLSSISAPYVPKPFTAYSTASVVMPVNSVAVVNMWKDDVSPDETMVATRLCTITGVDTSSDSYNVYVEACGTEIVTDATIVAHNANESTGYTILPLAALAIFPSGSASGTFGYAANYENMYVNFITKFDNMFPVRIGATASAGTSLTMLTDGSINDVSNYVIVSENTLSALHDVAVLSEFGVPLIGTKPRR